MLCAAGVAAGGLFVLLCGPASAATAISGSVDAAVMATMGYGPAVTASDQHTDTAAGLPGALSTQAHTVAEYNGDTVVVDVANSAAWQDADHGQFAFSASWDFSFTQPSTGNETAQFGFHPLFTGDWTYVFTANRDGEIVFDYDLTSTGQTFGIGGWSVRWRRQGVPGTNGEFLTGNILIDDPDGFVQVQGSHAVELAQGETYTFWLENNGNVSNGSETRAAATNGTINWHISGVPEPTTWSLMIFGIGMAGAAIRSKVKLRA
ncbi:PEPxxWA-CTERM sorting domain-containing protein [Phenylobacterium sp.]|uniref:PEPxxWA-CTERM sorting domain-containing protein n=1 Tax=Phenylobacterium sp. TaxID=1871053 RepID=UPI0025FB0B80|nr:PEPxxWA-CTERM sorting domain-containing protein [Phenylobacterium sp.]